MLLFHGGLLGVDGFADADGLGGDRGDRGQRPTWQPSRETAANGGRGRHIDRMDPSRWLKARVEMRGEQKF